MAPIARFAAGFIALLGFFESAFAGLLKTGLASQPTVTIKNGTYAGEYNAFYGEDYFLGMPYAQPPLRQLRLDNPRSLNASFSGVKQATAYYPQCVGYGGDDIGYAVSEDCLAINVIRPHGHQNQSLPVAVWIHGGGFVMGGSADRRYNLTFIVQNAVAIGKPIIGVSFNYRLSGWGFLQSDEIQSQGVANLGLKDQRLALQWIQENIGAFGGDKDKVTIWGESAGAASVGAQALAYGGRDDRLFRAVIAESGGPLQFVLPPMQESNAKFANIGAAAGCSDSTDQLACLRSVPFDTLNQALNVTPSYPFGPVIDGDFLQNYSSVQLNEGAFVKVPLLIGANTDEGTSFYVPGINTDAEFAAAIEANGPDAETTARLAELYPDVLSAGIPYEVTTRLDNATFGYQYKRSAALFGDATIIAGRRFANEAWAKYGGQTYSYRFNVLVNGIPYTTASTHFQEVAFVFNNLQGLGYAINPFGGEPESYATLSRLMSRAWVSFVHDLDPNKHGVSGIPPWPLYGAGNRSAQNFIFDANVTSHVEPDTFRAAGIEYLNEVSVQLFR